MKLDIHRDRLTCTTHLVVEWTDNDLIGIDFDAIDLMQLREPMKDAADILLDAELIVRRWLQTQHPKGNNT